MRIAEAMVAMSLIACAQGNGAKRDASADVGKPTCEGLGLVCSPPSCPPGTGIFGIAGRPECASGQCCEPCNPPNVLSGSICITAGQSECDQRGGACADPSTGACPPGLVKGGGTCGDGVTVPFAPCCLP